MDKKNKALRHALRSEERAKSRAAFPIPPDDLVALFDMLDRDLAAQGCDHTRRLTQAWLVSRGHAVDRTFTWLDQHGGFCDCEVLANVEEHVSDALMDWKH